MAKIKQKGKSGAAVNYITRNQAIKKLQVTLADFRRLCILKGIYPREPKNKKKANKGSTAPATFYYTKDIQYLLHEPLIQKFRDHKIFVRKLGKALGKGQTSVVKNLQENKPVYTLDHIVKERYPSFTDALRDLDDALCMIFLFANSPATDKVQRESVKECRRLSAEFQHYVMQTSSLRKVFLSIKGIYYQCEIKGQTISWLVPYQFSQDVPTDVDFRVMNSFLEFYQTLIGFVNYKLYTDENLVYPPKFDKSKEDGGAGLDAYVLESVSAVNMEITPEPQEEVQKPVQESVKKSEKRLGSLAQKIANIKDNSASESRVEAASKEEDTIDEFPQELNQEGKVFSLNDVKAASNALSALQSLFSNQVIFLSREVPKYSLEFVIKAFGGKVGWDSSVAAGSPFDENDERITVQICDRPVQGHMFLSRVYTQPQWIYDCVNAKKLLSVEQYAPGASLPPHLSPFVEYKEGDYIPEAAGFDGEVEEIDEQDVEVAEDEESDSDDSDDEEAENEEEQAPVANTEESEHQKELEAEAAGVAFSEYQQKRGKKNTKTAPKISKEKQEEVEAKELAKIMMTKKKRQLYNKIQHSKNKTADETNKLKRRKEELAAKAKKQKKA